MKRIAEKPSAFALIETRAFSEILSAVTNPSLIIRSLLGLDQDTMDGDHIVIVPSSKLNEACNLVNSPDNREVASVLALSLVGIVKSANGPT